MLWIGVVLDRVIRPQAGCDLLDIQDPHGNVAIYELEHA